MAEFTFLDNGVSFDGLTPSLLPMGGAESAIVSLAEALAARGHDVTVRNRCKKPITHKGVHWRPIGTDPTNVAGAVVANRDPRLFRRAHGKCKNILWLHNDARYLRKLRYAQSLLSFRPQTVFLSDYHASTWPFPRWWLHTHIIPLGVDSSFEKRRRDTVMPSAKAVFASNPERGLSQLLDLWVNRIHPTAPHAEFHLFTRADFYGLGNKAARLAEPIIARAATLEKQNVILHDMVPRTSLATFYPNMRAMLYWGDADHAETFCLSVAEAQASALPCVARPMGALPERVGHGETGFLELDEDNFAAAAIALLTDDEAWRRCRDRAVNTEPTSWDDAAARFEALHG